MFSNEKPCNKCKEAKRMSYKSYCRPCYNGMQKKLRDKKRDKGESLYKDGWAWYYTLWM